MAAEQGVVEENQARRTHSARECCGSALLLDTAVVVVEIASAHDGRARPLAEFAL